jgi:hypothetical protein
MLLRIIAHHQKNILKNDMHRQSNSAYLISVHKGFDDAQSRGQCQFQQTADSTRQHPDVLALHVHA